MHNEPDHGVKSLWSAIHLPTSAGLPGPGSSGWGHIGSGTYSWPKNFLSLSPLPTRQGTSSQYQNSYLDLAVSLFVDILVFVNSTKISTNSETAMLSIANQILTLATFGLRCSEDSFYFLLTVAVKIMFSC